MYAEKYGFQVKDYISQMRDQYTVVDAQRQQYLEQSELTEKKIRSSPLHSEIEKKELSAVLTQIHNDDVMGH